MPLRPLRTVLAIKTEEEKEPEYNWYIINTYHTLENRVKKNIEIRSKNLNLNSKIVQVLVPTAEKVIYKEGRRTVHRQKLFPGYLLIYMQLENATFECVQGTTGVASFVTSVHNDYFQVTDEFNPIVLTEEEINNILDHVRSASRDLEKDYNTGDFVTIMEGPMDGLQGEIKRINNPKNSFTILVELMGTKVLTEVPAILVERV